MNQNICRLCNENVGITSLFDLAVGIQLSEKVKYCAKVAVEQGDGLPASVCAACEEQLASTYSFVLKCEHVDKELRALQSSVKQEWDSETKYDPSTQDFGDSDHSETLDDYITKEIKVEPQTKRKYVKTSCVRRKSKDNPRKCDVCGRTCSSRSSLAIHMRSHTNEKPYACLSCDKKYKDSGTLKRHIERNHNNSRMRSFICEHCGKGFYSQSDCKIHTRIHTGETPYACTKCPARFAQIGTLQRHTLTHTGERSHLCTKCSKKFPTKEQLKTHYLVHTDEKKYKCPLCEIPFKSKTNMMKHIKNHSSVMRKNYICNFCHHCFVLKGNLQLHITKQHSSKSGYCAKCSKHFPNIEMHMWKHSGVRPVKCELCPSSFFDAKGLATHMTFRHKSTDKYKCTVPDCTLKFPNQPMLDYHVMRYHESIKPISCDKCPRRFYRKSDMVRHRKGSHKEFKIE